MNDKFGSIRSMLKRWRINLKKKKKKDLELELEKKNKKKSKIISFLYNSIAIIIIPFGYLFEKNNVKKNLNELNNKINIANKEELELIQQDIEKMRHKAEKLNNKNLKIQLNNLEKKINDKKEKYALNKELKLELDKKIIKDNKEIKVKSNSKDNKEIKVKNNSKENKEPKVKNDNKEINQPIDNLIKVNTEIQIKQIVKDVKQNYDGISKANLPKLVFNNEKKLLYEKLSDMKEKLEIMIIKLNKISEYNHFYFYEKELDMIDNDLIDLLKRNHELLCKIKQESLYEYNKLNNLIEEVKSKLESNKKFIDVAKNNLVTKDNKKQEKNNEKEEKKLKKEEKKQEIFNNKYILENILKQQEYLISYFKVLQNSNNKKNAIKNNFSYFLNNFLPKSLMPLFFIKNKFLSSIIIGIIFNNSIKTMRKMINSSIKIEYTELAEKFINIKSVYSDSYMQIQELRNDLIATNIIDEQIFEQLDQMEKICLDNMEQIDLNSKAIQKILIKDYKN